MTMRFAHVRRLAASSLARVCPAAPLRTVLILVSLSLALLPGRALAQASSGYVHTDGEKLLDGSAHELKLRGTNLGNWLEPEGYMFLFNGDGQPTSPREIEDYFNELIGPDHAQAFWRSFRDNYITKADLDFLKATGVNSVRIPLHYRFFTPGNQEGFRLVDRVVHWAKEDGIYVILDMHQAPGGQTGTNIDDSYGYPWLYDSPAAQQELIEIWRRIAQHYAGEPAVLGYDLLNEPIPHFPELQKYNPQLEPIYRRVTAAIREVDPHHVIILGGAQWDTNFRVFSPPFDSNVMYQIHLYEFNTPWNAQTAAKTEAHLQQYLDFRSKYHVPVWLGEAGENDDAWVEGFRTMLEKHDIGWCFWPYKKMQSSSSFVAFAKPEHWDEIVKYAGERHGVGNTEKQLKLRPSIEDSSAALNQLLDNVRLAKCRVNSGYIRALGLTVPEGSVAQP